MIPEPTLLQRRPASKKRPTDTPAPDTIAVIDVGSNSVRLVVYEVEEGRCRYLLNEKTQAGLGRGLSDAGKLCPDGIRIALSALTRYARLLETLGISRICTGATGAVRDAFDGRDFCQQVKTATGIKLRILSGEEEARYAALGVLMSYADGAGLVGDLGGWSLELARLKGGRYAHGATCALGPLALEGLGMAPDQIVRDHTQKLVRNMASFKTSDRLYLVGGAWRAIGRLHMWAHKWPLPQLQRYEMTAKSLRRFLKRLSNTDPDLEPLVKQIAPRRARHLPYAAMVLDTLLAETGAQQAMMSLSGVREGLLMEALGGIPGGADILLPPIRAEQAALAQATADWIAHIQGLPDPALIRAACTWSLAIAALVPDGRAEIGFAMIVQADLRSLSHPDRIMLALAVASSHNRTFTSKACETLLREDQRASARGLGALIRLAGELSGTTSVLLKTTCLKAQSDRLVLETIDPCLVSETVERRLTQAALLLDRSAQVRSIDSL